MPENDVQSLKDRLTSLEVMFREKWDSHDKRSDEIWNSHNKRSDERWADLMEQMHELSHKQTPCQDHIRILAEFSQRVGSLERKVSFIETATWSAIGLVVVGGLITLAIKHITG